MGSDLHMNPPKPVSHVVARDVPLDEALEYVVGAAANGWRTGKQRRAADKRSLRRET